MSTVARDLGMRPQTLRVSVRQDDAHDGVDGLMTCEPEESAGLRPEDHDLPRSNEILKAASESFARELDRPCHQVSGFVARTVSGVRFVSASSL